MFKIVKRYFDLGIYSAANVGMFVKASKITTDEYKTITGTDYIEA